MTAFCYRTPRILGTLALVSFSLLPATARAAGKAKILGRAATSQSVAFDVYLPLQHRDTLETLLRNQQDSKSPEYHKWLKPAEFESRFGADPKAVASITSDLSAEGLSVTHPASQKLHVTGSVDAVERALGTTLMNASYSNGKGVIVAASAIAGPASLGNAGAMVTGLSGKAPMRSYARRSAVQPDNRYSSTGGYWFDDLKQAYKFPSYQTYTGKGAHIGIIMSGGYLASDMNQYFGHEKLKTPSYVVKNVNGGAPYDPNNGGTFESNLDLQQSGGMAPNAQITLYSIPDLTDENIIDDLLQILSDNTMDVVSMSFGEAELYYTAAFNDGVDYTYLAKIEDDLFAQGNAQGITFIASSGDSGALEAVPLQCFTGEPNCGKFLLSASFPATSPHVVGVGGTDLVTTSRPGDLDSAYIRESAFADPLAVDIFFGTSATGGYWGSGGGNSILFAKPTYQQLVSTGDTKTRTVPDLSLHMGGCPGGTLFCQPDDSYDIEVLAGQYVGVIGTSASAPDFAGLTALNIERFGTRLGNENYYIYALAAAQDAGGLPLKVFNEGINGFNGYYHTTPTGYNRVLGNGSVNGANFLLAPAIPVAGFPQTPSNP